ncbi:MAG: class I SAM-dependent methyltransferase [Verrucomicrobiales bacterium]|jgi:23S rRNA (cytosine1962-C5)-methyltransferase|nr:class I SAM-dependent methyltransferase [Verrucomicrobiales bacterium]
MKILTPGHWPDYELIDSGGFEKLERFGEYVVRRPEPKAVWARSCSAEEWRADATFTAGVGAAGKEDGGTWSLRRGMRDRWRIQFQHQRMDLNLRLGLTSFKHLGVFPEQAPNWRWIYDTVQSLTAPKVLNLFAYTGGASLAARAAGATVTHLDSVKQVVTWARENMEASGLADIRWMVDDALKFARREAKRGNVYQGILLDPPAYGHGADGQRWKLDENILEMLQACQKILAPRDSFLLLNLYSNGFSALVADTLTMSIFGADSQRECGELTLTDRFGKRLPLSVFSRVRL